MDTIPVARATAFRAIADGLARLGEPSSGRLEQLGIPLDALDHEDRFLPERPAWALLDKLHRRVEDVGFRLGASHGVLDIPNLGPLLRGQATLRQLLTAFCLRLRTHSNHWAFWVEDTRDGVRLCRLGTPMDVGRWPMEQYALSYMVDLVRLAAPDDWWPGEVWLERDEVLLPAELQWLRDAEVHQGSPVTAITVPASLLAERPQGLAESLPPETEAAPVEFFPAFREVLRSLLVGERPRLSHVGDVFGVHERTLQRRLSNAGTTFAAVLDDVRLEAACVRLEDSDQPLAEIGEELGYATPAAFSTAFRRWAGVSPIAYRRTNRAAAPAEPQSSVFL